MSTLSVSNLKTNSYPAVGVDRKRSGDFDLNFSGKVARIPSMENCGYEVPSGSYAPTENPFSRLEELERFAMIESLADRANCNLDSRTDSSGRSSPTSSLENHQQRIPDRKKYIPAENNISRIESDDTVDAGDAIGRWTKNEHEQFLKGLRTVGKNWRQIAGNFVRTRTEQQIRTHAAAYFEKMSKMPCMGGKQAVIAPRSNARTVSMGNGSAEAAAPVAAAAAVVAPPAPTLVRSQTLEAAQTLQGFSYFAPMGTSGASTMAGLVPVSTPGGLEVVQPLTLPTNPAAASGLLFPSAAAVEHYNQYMLTIAAQYYQMAAMYQPPAGMAPTPAAGGVPTVSAFPSPTLAGLPAPPSGLTALPLRPSINSVIASAVSVAVSQYLPQIQAGVTASAKQQLQFATEEQQQMLTAANLPAAYTAGEPVLLASASSDEADQQAPQSPVSLPSELQAREAESAAVLAEAPKPAVPLVAAAPAAPATMYTPPEPKRVRTPEEIEAHKAAQRAKHLETLRLEAEKRQRQKEKEDFKEAQRQLKLQMQAQNKLQKAAAAAYRAGVEPASVVAALPNPLSALGASPHTNQLQVAEILSNLARN